jgi:hypothetical protein
VRADFTWKSARFAREAPGYGDRHAVVSRSRDVSDPRAGRVADEAQGLSLSLCHTGNGVAPKLGERQCKEAIPRPARNDADQDP